MSRTYRKDRAGWDFFDSWKTASDTKKWYKPTKKFKKVLKNKRKAKEKQALRTGDEIPRFKKEDEWAWN